MHPPSFAEPLKHNPAFAAPQSLTSTPVRLVARVAIPADRSPYNSSSTCISSALLPIGHFNCLWPNHDWPRSRAWNPGTDPWLGRCFVCVTSGTCMRALGRLNTPETSRHLTNALRWFDLILDATGFAAHRPWFSRCALLSGSSFPQVKPASTSHRRGVAVRLSSLR